MVQGLADFDRRWGNVPALVRDAVRREMEQIAQNIVDEMYTAAPHLTGDLAGSIDWTWGDAPAGSMTIGKVGGKEYGSMAITIYAGGSDAFYARFQEFGTRKMPANPFFYPVWRARRKTVKARVGRAIRAAIKKA